MGCMPEGETRSESMEEVVSQWARKDPTATAEWLNQFPPVSSWMSRLNGLSGKSRKDPETAMTWAEAIVDEQRGTDGCRSQSGCRTHGQASRGL